MKVILLAAGSGTRLGHYTKEIPKALVDINGQSILKRLVTLYRDLGVSDITIVTGPYSEKFNIKNVGYIYDQKHLEHDALGSLMFANSMINDEVIFSYTDILYDKSIAQSVIDFKGDIGLAVHLNWEKSYKPALASINNDSITKIGHDKSKFNFENEMVGEYVGLMKLSKNGSKVLMNKFNELQKSSHGSFHEASSLEDAYPPDMIQELIDSKIKIEPIIVSGKWCEIDTIADLEKVKNQFGNQK